MLPIDPDQCIYVPPEVARCPICAAPIVIANFTQTEDIRYTPENIHLRCTQESHLPPNQPAIFQAFIRDHYTYHGFRSGLSTCLELWYHRACLVADWLNALLAPDDLPANTANYTDTTW